MSAFMYGVVVQWKLDLRNRGILLTYYVVPLLFFSFMGAIFTSIDPAAKDTLIQTMTIFGVTMGAILGAPTPLVELYGSEIRKAYSIGGIPLWVVAVNNYLSAFIHLLIMSLVVFICAPLMYDAVVPTHLWLYFLSLVIFIMASLAVGTVLGLFIRSAMKLTMLAQLIFLPSIMLSGIMFQADLLPNEFGIAGKFFPATWGMQSMTSEVLDLQLYIPLAAILVISIAVSWYRLSTMVAE